MKSDTKSMKANFAQAVPSEDLQTARAKTREKLGFVELLERSATVLEREALGIRDAHTYRGRWTGEFGSGAKLDYVEMMMLVKSLRRSAKYHKPNPMGGPAVIFDACANAIRAGDPIKSAMANFGLAFKRKKG